MQEPLAFESEVLKELQSLESGMHAALARADRMDQELSQVRSRLFGEFPKPDRNCHQPDKPLRPGLCGDILGQLAMLGTAIEALAQAQEEGLAHIHLLQLALLTPRGGLTGEAAYAKLA